MVGREETPNRTGPTVQESRQETTGSDFRGRPWSTTPEFGGTSGGRHTAPHSVQGGRNQKSGVSRYLPPVVSDRAQVVFASASVRRTTVVAVTLAGG